LFFIVSKIYIVFLYKKFYASSWKKWSASKIIKCRIIRIEYTFLSFKKYNHTINDKLVVTYKVEKFDITIIAKLIGYCDGSTTIDIEDCAIPKNFLEPIPKLFFYIISGNMLVVLMPNN
jgi:hypothetical protein